MKFQDIFLIDDDVEDLEILQDALGKVSETIKGTQFTNAAEALEQLKNAAKCPQLIFLDLNMPLMSGQEFITEIKKLDKLKDIPVYIFSTTSNIKTKENLKQLGADDFITKPNRFDTLVEILKIKLQY